MNNVDGLKTATIPMGTCNCACCIYTQPFIYFRKTGNNTISVVEWEETKCYAPKRIQHTCMDISSRAKCAMQNDAKVPTKSPSWI